MADGDPLARARSLAPLLEASTASIDRERRLPDEVVEAVKGQGLFHLLLPRAYGGGEVEPARFVGVVEELARHDASTAWCVGQTGVCAVAAAYLPAESAQRVFDGGRGILAWGAPGRVVARAEPGGYRVTGRWSFASGGHLATWVGAHCLVGEADGSPRREPDGRPATRTLLFPADAVSWEDDWDVLGLRGTASDSYSVEDLFVSDDLTLERAHVWERRIDAPLYRMRTDNLYACGFAALALGVARAMLDALVELAVAKTPRGFANPLGESAVVQSEVARLEARLRSSRHYLYGTLDQAWSAVAAGELPISGRVALRLASTHCIEQARGVAATVYHLAGSSAIRRGGPFEQRFRDLNTAAQQVQGRWSHYETVGRYLLGAEAETDFL